MALIVNIIGLINILLCAISFSFKKRKYVLLSALIYNILVLIQYCIQGYLTEVSLILIDIIKSLVFYIYAYKKWKPNFYIIIITETILILSFIFTFENWFSIFVLLSSMLFTYASWQNNLLFHRICAAICSILLITNYLFTGLYTTIIAESITLIAATLSFLRHHKKSKYYNMLNKNNYTLLSIDK